MTDMRTKQTRPKRQPTGNYPVGYAKPSEDAKWKPGQSGNPSGRPKKPSDPDQMFMKHAMKETKVKIGDQTEQMTNFEVMLLSLFQQGAKGNIKAIKIVLDKYRETYRDMAASRTLEPQEEFSWEKEQEELWQMLEKVRYGEAEDKDADDDENANGKDKNENDNNNE